MNAGKLCYCGDFTELLRAADVVIEGSRPAALARHGLSAEQVVARPGRVWIRISGYGSAQPERVAFGDDAAVAGGLVLCHGDGPAFCGDAIADPLTGLEAAAAVLAALDSGGGVIVDVSMAAVAATYAALAASEVTTTEPRLPNVPGRAHELGADNDRVRELIEPRLLAC
jgi:crotonobetainyl-CoA:carnitine CoA-transferase CaiB-like acyl-CoA transferase